MKRIYLIPLSLSTIILSSTIFISCAATNITAEEKLQQQILINQVVAQRLAPKITLNEEINVNLISSKINFKNISNKYKDLSFKILNFEIPLVGLKDANINVEVSSKIDESINSQKYKFKISESITNNNLISVMIQKDFNESIEKNYLTLSNLGIANFTSDDENLINLEIKNASLDITEKIYNKRNREVVSILDYPPSEEYFIKKMNESVIPNLLKRLNERYIQSNLSIEIVEVIKTNNPDFDNQGVIKFKISLGSTFYPKKIDVMVNQFSTKYKNLEVNLEELILQRFKPTLTIPSSIKIPASKIYEYLNLELPNLENSNNFDISIIIPPGSINSADSRIEISIFNRDYESLEKGYYITISEVIGYNEGVINFNTKINKRDETWI